MRIGSKKIGNEECEDGVEEIEKKKIVEEKFGKKESRVKMIEDRMRRRIGEGSDDVKDNKKKNIRGKIEKEIGIEKVRKKIKKKWLKNVLEKKIEKEFGEGLLIKKVNEIYDVEKENGILKKMIERKGKRLERRKGWKKEKINERKGKRRKKKCEKRIG